MAIVIPDSALGDRAYGINAGEKYLLNKLRTALPDGCLIWHNIDLPNHYQPDIVAYLPRFGVKMLAVKLFGFIGTLKGVCLKAGI